MEEFTLAEVAQTLDCSQPEAQALIDQAGRELAGQLCANILIIEDELPGGARPAKTIAGSGT